MTSDQVIDGLRSEGYVANLWQRAAGASVVVTHSAFGDVAEGITVYERVVHITPQPDWETSRTWTLLFLGPGLPGGDLEVTVDTIGEALRRAREFLRRA